MRKTVQSLGRFNINIGGPLNSQGFGQGKNGKEEFKWSEKQ